VFIGTKRPQLGTRDSILKAQNSEYYVEGIAPAQHSVAFRRNFPRNNSITVDSSNQTASSLPSGVETTVRSCLSVRSSAENQKQKDHRQIKVWTGYLGVTSCSPLVSLVIGCAHSWRTEGIGPSSTSASLSNMRLVFHCPSERQDRSMTAKAAKVKRTLHN
jgi:hypothetical protein